MTTFEITPERTALLVVDLQNCFVAGYPVSAPQGPDVLERLNGLARACRRGGVQVIYTAHVVRPDHSNAGVLAELVPPVRAGIIDDGAESAALHPGLRVEAGDIVLKKPRFGAFYGTDLDIILRAKGIDTVIIGGIATNFCCETTAREAMAHDFRVLFLSDGTATFDLPDLGMGPVSAADAQRATCTSLAFGYAEVLTVAQAVARIETGLANGERNTPDPIPEVRPEFLDE